MNNNRLNIILLCLSILLLTVAVILLQKLPDDLASISSSPAKVQDSTTLERLALINSAVKSPPPPRYFEYTGGFENPFKPEIQLPHHRGPSRAALEAARTKLTLKGILSKNKPLAILEDGMGETYIRGVGEKAIDQTVTAISGNSVTLRDHLGTYVLMVEEQ